MKKLGIYLIISLLIVTLVNGQDSVPVQKDKPIRSPFESGMLIDNETMVIPTAKTLELVIQHRFGEMSNGMEDFYGIWAPSNIRLGFNYSILNTLMVGVGTSKDYRLQDFRMKYNLLQQTRSDKIPLSITLYGNFAIDARNQDVFEGYSSPYELIDRFSYFGELILTRKFSDIFTLQLSGSFSHINKVPEGIEHDKIGLSFAGRFKISPQSSILFQYDIPLDCEKMKENAVLMNVKPNFGVAWEIATSSHAFQIILSSAKLLSRQYDMIYNEYDWTEGDIMLGFNMTRLWSF